MNNFGLWRIAMATALRGFAARYCRISGTEWCGAIVVPTKSAAPQSSASAAQILTFLERMWSSLRLTSRRLWLRASTPRQCPSVMANHCNAVRDSGASLETQYCVSGGVCALFLFRMLVLVMTIRLCEDCRPDSQGMNL